MEGNSIATKSHDMIEPEPPQDWRENELLIQWSGFWFSQERLQAVKETVINFKPLPSDIILASFPKTGTTWLKALIFSIVNRSSPTEKSLIKTNNPHKLIPHLEFNIYGPNPQDITSFPSTNMSGARIMGTHLPYNVLEGNVYASNCRVVYVTRNLKGTIVSYWKFFHKVYSSCSVEENMKLEDLADKFCDGSVPFGPYYDHVLGYWKKSLEMPEKVYFVTYEELQEDPITHVKRLGKFLGYPFESDDEVEEIVRCCSFENLSKYKANKSNKFVMPLVNIPSNAFFRQGKVGDHLNYMNHEMIEKIDSITKQKFHDSGFIYGV